MSGSKRYPVIQVRLVPSQVELAQLRLWELGATGIEERDDSTLGGGSEDGYVVLSAAFEDDRVADRAFAEVRQDYEAELSVIAPADWSVEWRRGFRAQRIGKRLFLRPSWDPTERPHDREEVTIDPENAFGSGDHETTRLVLRVLDQRVMGGESILDVGCGSGVLSIAALRLGAGGARGVDVDPDAVRVARRNADRNGVGGSFEATSDPLEAIPGSYNLVLANIEAGVLRKMKRLLGARVAPGGVLVLSGILTEERDAMVEAYRGFEVAESLVENQWCALVLEARP